MSKMRSVISKPRADLMKMACVAFGGQEIVAEKLEVTPGTVSRWCRMTGPIPEAAFLWAQMIVKETIDSNETDDPANGAAADTEQF